MSSLGADGDRAQARTPRIGIVIPVYSHSGLLYEAVLSVLEQQDAPAHATVVVNDGCRLNETDLVGTMISAREDVHYVYRRNGGLSAARNTGIEYLLNRYPSLEAIYLLDADNYLQPFALATMADALLRHPEAAWFYPDIEMFGLRASASLAGVYSSLVHTATNVSEAGSLIRRSVLDAGVRFDETMRHGFEDWEFWLSALQQGFKGRHLPGMGFKYRKRAESMLAESSRDEVELKTYIRRKHADLYRPQTLLQMEAQEAPRYAIFSDDGIVRVGLDPVRPMLQMSVAAFEAVFWRWMLRPDIHYAPPFLAWISQGDMLPLATAGLLRWALWDLESRLAAAQLVQTIVQPWAEAGATIGAEVRGAGNVAPGAQMAMVASDVVRGVLTDADTSWWESLTRGPASSAVSFRTLSTSRLTATPDGAAGQGLAQRVLQLRQSVYRQALQQEWSWTFSGQPSRHLAYQAARHATLGGAVYPLQPDGRRHVAFLLPYIEFGGVEKVAFNVAAELKAAGFVPHLVLFRTGDVHLPNFFSEIFESISWVTSPGMLQWDGEEYLGTSLSRWARSGDQSDALGLLSVFSAIINCHSPDANGLMAHLRRRGLLTISHQHVLEYSEAGRPVGHPMLARAYEHAYDYILACSHQLGDWLIGSGVPMQKVLVVENAPSFVSDAATLSTATIARRKREAAGEPLRVLYAGRFDRQKGLDRLNKLIRATAGDARFAWRVLGRSIVDDDPALEELRQAIATEPSVDTAEAMQALLAWADVLVLPSRYEGVPLMILEAQEAGVVVLTADCGAVREVVRNGVDGFVEPQEDCARHMEARLRCLQSDPELRRRLSEAAVAVASQRSWARSVAPLVEALTRALPSPERQARLEKVG